MNTKTLKTLILLSLPVMAQAQLLPAGTPAPYKTAQGHRLQVPRKALSTAKVTASDPVTGFARYIYFAGSPRLYDSAAYTWSGGRTSVQYSRTLPVDVIINDFDQRQQFMNLGGSIVPDQKTNNTYNTAGKVISSLTQTWNSAGGIWVNDERSSYTYTGAKTIMVRENWNSGTSGWQNSARTTTDSVAGVKDQISESWDGSKWTNEYHYQYHYSGAKITEGVSRQWKSGSWENVSRETCTYAGSDVTEILTQRWDVVASAWKNSSRTQVTYALGPGMDSEYKVDDWNNSTSSWDNNYRGLSTWTAGKLTERKDQDWDKSGTAWLDRGKTIFTYSGSGDFSSDVGQTWNFISMSWEDDFRYDYDYNSSNQMVRSLYSEKPSGGGSLEKFTEYLYYYAPTTGIPENKESLRNIRLYPNPSLYAQVYVDYATLTADETSIVLTDLTGKVLYQQAEPGSIGDHTVKIPVADLAKGIYLVQVYSNGKQVQTLKLNK